MDWLPQVIEAARSAALEDDRRAMGWEENDPRTPPFPYRWEHVQLVVRKGRWLLAQYPDADADVVIAACWLHDVRKREPEHAKRGADFARRLLPTIGFPAHKVPRVAQAIKQHEGMWRPESSWRASQPGPMPVEPPIQPLEAALVWDADKLSKVGPLTLVHWLPHHVRALGRAGKQTTTEALVEENRLWLKTLRARTLPSFNTEAARRRATELLDAYERFWTAAAVELVEP